MSRSAAMCFKCECHKTISSHTRGANCVAVNGGSGDIDSLNDSIRHSFQAPQTRVLNKLTELHKHKLVYKMDPFGIRQAAVV